MLKIITFIIAKIEAHLSKKNNCLWEKETNNEEIKLYRALLNEIDKYNYNTKKAITLRHYRYFTFEVGKVDE